MKPSLCKFNPGFYNVQNVLKSSIEDIQESQIIPFQWHQEEEQTNRDRQYIHVGHRPKNSKATSFLVPNKVITTPHIKLNFKSFIFLSSISTE